MRDVLRIIDANLNRSREALRVMEEAARFVLRDGPLARTLKELRHELAQVAMRLPPEVTAARDVACDVGAAITTEQEAARNDLQAVAVAAGKRLSEALRCLEEYGKLVDPVLATAAKALRYRGYEAERMLERRLRRRCPQWTVCVLLTEALCRRPWQDVAREAFLAGADCIQLREKSLDDRELLRRARWLVSSAPEGASVVVNDRVDIALLAGAHGVHLGQGDLSVVDVRRIAGDALIVGASTHDAIEAERAVAEGADYCGVGPMFESALKPDLAAAGPALLRAFVEQHPGVPHLAIGGITPRNIGALRDVGCRGVAVSTAVCGAPDPGSVVREMVSALADTP